MPAVLTGTPTVVTWASGANPAGQSITIPGDATAVYMFWAFYEGTATGLASATLAGNAPAQEIELNGSAIIVASGMCAWYNPSTGSQTLDVAWDAAPSEGPVCIVAYTKDGDTTAWRDADLTAQTSTDPASVTLTTVAGDLVIKFDQKTGATPPSLSSGWTSAQTGANVNMAARLSYISASGATQVCDSEDEDYSCVVALAIPESTGGGGGWGVYYIKA